MISSACAGKLLYRVRIGKDNIACYTAELARTPHATREMRARYAGHVWLLASHIKKSGRGLSHEARAVTLLADVLGRAVQRNR
jgi:hypothetical protein